jgi:hypothetical protein
MQCFVYRCFFDLNTTSPTFIFIFVIPLLLYYHAGNIYAYVCFIIYYYNLLYIGEDLMNLLKIPKEYSEGVNRSTDNDTMAKRKRTKRQTMIYKTINRKLQTKQHEAHKTRG